MVCYKLTYGIPVYRANDDIAESQRAVTAVHAGTMRQRGR